MSSTALFSLCEFNRLDDLLEDAGMHRFRDEKQQAVRDKAAQVLIERLGKYGSGIKRPLSATILHRSMETSRFPIA
ncbi:hypothetical protein SAMN03159422_05267 [Agrobacterium fabrum]|uniref:hypothetical protein n=1 Tax=Agrobacterium fabrum TaxID=1176649 RepID=UPI00088A13E5|nr:hypothetical protein [Agrobacterium fabrum]SDB74420.1 hypothetical protein SAMN03159422_05267 [Agrobacterium fabrum]SES24284.1 hypothetical protein SAMN03159504_05256 [Agrobacterium fabrum]